jgi:formylglycine-generating enzyme required for sulfatase activity
MNKMANDWAAKRQEVLAASTSDFGELVRLAGLDPTLHLRFADWSGVDFRGSDLRDFDFTGSSLVGCDFTGALIEGARFDQAEIDRVGCDPTSRTDLRRAQEWEAFASKWARARPRLKDNHLYTGSVFQDAPFAPEMVMVPGGGFVMGESELDHMKFSDSRVQGVDRTEVRNLSAFAVSRFVVTWDEWKSFIQSGGRDAFGDLDRADGRWRFDAESHKEARGEWTVEDLASGRMPATNLTWHDAKAYVAWLSHRTAKPYRLLTHIEWEYVARAGTRTTYWWGDTITTGLANYNPAYRDPSSLSEEETMHPIKNRVRRDVVPVDRYAPNPWGLYQVHGNVWEWCEGWQIPEEQTWDKDNPHFSIDPALMVAPVRGGAFHSGAGHCRAAALMMEFGVQHSRSVGFRVGRNLAW